jgi:hypothetical protein
MASLKAERRSARSPALPHYVDAYVPADGDPTWSLTSERFRDVFATGAASDGLTMAPPSGLDPRCKPHPIAASHRMIRLAGAWRRVPRRVYLAALAGVEVPSDQSMPACKASRRGGCGRSIVRTIPQACARDPDRYPSRRGPGELNRQHKMAKARAGPREAPRGAAI